jgi:hypothetical protein
MGIWCKRDVSMWSMMRELGGVNGPGWRSGGGMMDDGSWFGFSVRNDGGLLLKYVSIL